MLLKSILTTSYNALGFPEPTFFRRNGKTYITIYPLGIPISLRWPMDRFHEIANIDRFNENLSEEDKIFYLTRLFEERVGYKPDFDNPRTFNEKIQWLKFHYRNPLLTQCADKYKVREYISQTIGEEYLVPLIDVYVSVDEIDFNTLPEQFVLKINWGSGQNIICREKSNLDWEKTKKQLNKWLVPNANNYYGAFEWGYKNIPPRIVCEKYLSELEFSPYVYKIMCFNGEPNFIQLVVDDKRKNESINYYDTSWRLLPFRQSFPNNSSIISAPKHLAKMFELARILSKPFPFVRTDFYEIHNQIFFSELTFYSDAGLDAFYPNEWDYTFGDMFDISKLK